MRNPNYLGHSANGGTIITFGVHKGKKLKDIPTSYFQYLLDRDICFKAIKHYCKVILKLKPQQEDNQ